ncbi:carbon monoxide dehydrogenase subunit G [Belnapia sp. T6]|uniref:Carbon monoxide dehydrogenase subunit G n=1 Tax=Belnapia mucosa TaxID=2804532 RepID=A0ABS1V866_9PROT|nr:carbon monoxide dehydrogenase subunit G [Belnapia mucosa]MBL6457858.1 carbon monoxide dehydrogenase subunit G [Belnapia mucosa]
MEMTGERRIPAPRQTVWEALNDPEVLQASIPGCESVERVGDDQFQAKVALKLGPMSAKFGGKVKLENLNPPASYTITGEGNGGAMGFAKGGADVALEEIGPSETLLTYNVKAQVGGKMAQLGGRLIDSTAKQMADQFFNRFAAHLTPPPPAEPVAEPAPAMATANGAPPQADGVVTAQPVQNTDTEYLRDIGGPGPLTQHGAEGPSAAGKPVHRPNPRPIDPVAAQPLRLLGSFQPFGLPLQFWGGCAIMLVILALLFL